MTDTNRISRRPCAATAIKRPPAAIDLFLHPEVLAERERVAGQMKRDRSGQPARDNDDRQAFREWRQLDRDVIDEYEEIRIQELEAGQSPAPAPPDAGQPLPALIAEAG